MSCCKGNKTINNLQNPSYVKMAEVMWNEVKDTPVDELTTDQIIEMRNIYKMVYPNSKGQPSDDQLPTLMNHISQYMINFR